MEKYTQLMANAIVKCNLGFFSIQTSASELGRIYENYEFHGKEPIEAL